MFYVFKESTTLSLDTATSLDLNNANSNPMGRQPLIQFTFGKFVLYNVYTVYHYLIIIVQQTAGRSLQNGV